MRNIVLFSCLIIISLNVNAQSTNDSILTYERKTDRPLTLHKGQLQINPGYSISVMSKEFDSKGKKLDLAVNGTASVLHRYLFELNYGILDFIQASVALNYSKRGERLENRVIFVSDVEPFFNINYFNDYKGFEDIYLGTVFKLPFKTKKFEFALSPGILIPLFSNKPKAPENSIDLISGTYPYYNILYHNNYKTGNGSLAYKIGASAIVRAGSNFRVFAHLDYSAPLSEGESANWIHQLDGLEFEYRELPYKYLISNALNYQLSLEYQAISWLNLSLSFIGETKSAGWSEKSGVRIGNPETSLGMLTPAYEIKITANLWISQSVNIPVIGKNQQAPVCIYTEISYNLFLLKSSRPIDFSDVILN